MAADPAAAGAVHITEQPQQRGLAGAVVTKQGHPLALLDREAEIVKSSYRYAAALGPVQQAAGEPPHHRCLE